ncbi:MAG: histidine phosphatase family protein [Anaerolineales bacterium]
MRHLILVRHSIPEIRADLPAAEWQLSEAGRQRCLTLAEELRALDPAFMVTSREPKALETGRLVARELHLPVEEHADLHEHDRRDVPLMPSREAFEVLVTRLFREPDLLVFGRETAVEARERFTAAVQAVMEQHREGNVAIVSHGTVITLYVAEATGLDPVPFWRSLGLPALVVLSWPACELQRVVRRV